MNNSEENQPRVAQTRRRAAVVRGFRIYLAISFLVTAILLIFTMRDETWMGMKEIRPLYLVAAFLLSMAHHYFDCIRLQVLTWATGTRIGFMRAAEFTFGGLFLGAVTPFQSGGIPLQIYILTKEGMSVGQGSAVLIMRGLLVLLLVIFIMPPLVPFYREIVSDTLIQNIFRYLVILYAVLFFLFMSALFRTKRMKSRSQGLGRFLRRRRIVKTDRFDRFIEFAFKEVEDLKQVTLDYFGRQKAKLGLALLLSVFSIGTFVFIAPTLVLGMGLEVPVATAVFIQIILTYLLVFVPTPGGSGVAEAGSASLYSVIVPTALLGIYVVLWRFFTAYLGQIIGSFFVLRLLRTTGDLPEVSGVPPSSRQAR
jgi:uncharacterized protein (TIRG00374 family)